MVDIAQPQDVIKPTPAETLVAILAELAVAYVDRHAREHEIVVSAVDHCRELLADNASLGGIDLKLDDFLGALTGREGSLADGWRQDFRHACEALPPGRLRLWLADNCLASSLLEESALTGGIFMRRLDALLDVAEVPFCAADVQALFAELATDLAEAKVTWAHAGAVGAASLAAGAIGGFFMIPGTGFATRTGTSYFLDRLSRVDDVAEGCARLLTGAYAALAGRAKARTTHSRRGGT